MVNENKTRGDVAPGKTQVNWRITTPNFNKLQVVAPELGFFSVPALVNFILTKVLNDDKLYNRILKGDLKS